MKSLILLSLSTFLLCGNVCAREKTDIIMLVNGDRITGEIRQLQHNRLSVKTDSMGEVSIEWDKIENIESKYEFQFDAADGRRFSGKIEVSPEQKAITLRNEQETLTLQYADVVRIAQAEEKFLDRLKGSFSLGYNFTKASKVAQGNLAFQLSHQTEKRAISLSGSTIVTDDQSNEKTERTDLRAQMNRYIGKRWFAAYLLGFEKNDELGLKLRSSVGVGLGRYLIQNNVSEFAVLGGLLASRASLANDHGSEDSLEGLLGTQYSRYIFDDPTVDINVRLTFFPGITEPGHNRSQLDIDLRWEVFKDLFWQLSYYNTYDSAPQSGSITTGDYGVVTSLGWSF